MKKFMFLFLLMMIFASSAFAEYTSNTWASWASVTTQVDWTFPYSSRGVTLTNGSSVPICVSFGRSAVISASCTDAANDVFQLGANMFIYIDNLVRPEVHIRSASTAASPVSILVNY